MSTQNTLFRDYCKAENSDDEDNITDLQSRLYAEIYYAPGGQENMNAKRIVKQEAIDRYEALQNSHSKTNTDMQSNSNTLREEKPNVAQESGQIEQTSLSSSLNSTVTQNLSSAGVTQIKKDLDANTSSQVDSVRESLPNQETDCNTNKRSSIKSEPEVQIVQEAKPIPVLISTPIILKATPTPDTSSNVYHSKNDSSTVEAAKTKHTETKKEQENDRILEKYQFSKTFMQDLYAQKYQQIHKTFHQDAEDDTEMDTKYNVNSKKSKQKQKANDFTDDITIICDTDSDSEDSILEVPIPPKPKPPIINLNDSDGNPSSDSDSDDQPNQAPVRKKKKEQQQTIACKKSNKEKVTKGQSDKETSHNVRTAQNSGCIISVPDEDIVLNCTEVQKGASSLQEIKEMRKDVYSQHSPSTESAMRNNRVQAYNESLGQGDGRMATINTVSRKRRHEDDGTEATAAKQSKQTNVIQHPLPKSTTSVSPDPQREQTWEEYIFKPMSRQMKAFYNESRGQENFNINELQSQMSKDPRLWAILDDDLRPSSSKKHRFWNVKCNNCQRDGHQKYNCPEPRRPPVCHICSGEGHTESRCPQKMCLTCGRKQGTFRKTCESCQTMYCDLCRSLGHKSTECPDLWRRFHQTTRTTKINIPANLSEVMKPADLLYCCNCTRRGHESSTCKEYRWSPHFPTPSYVSNYTSGPGYMNPPVSVPQNGDVLLFSKRKSNRADTRKVAFQADEVNDEIATIIHTFGTFYKTQNGHEIKRCISQAKEYHMTSLINGVIYPTFLEKLYKIIQFQVLIYYDPHQNIMLRVRAHLMFAKIVYKFVLHWLHLEEDEKDAMVVDLPRSKSDMIEFLRPRINSYQNPCKDPGVIFAQIKECKHEMLCTKNQSILYNRQRRVYSLKLELLRYYHIKSKESKIGDKLKSRFEVLPQSSDFNTNPIEYLLIVYYYNKIFVPHTPPDVDTFLKRHSKRKKTLRRLSNKKCTPSKTFDEFVAALQAFDPNQPEQIEERTASPENDTPNKTKGKKAKNNNAKAEKAKKQKKGKKAKKVKAVVQRPPPKNLEYPNRAEIDFANDLLYTENMQPLPNTFGFVDAHPPERIQTARKEKNISETTRKPQSTVTTQHLTSTLVTHEQVSSNVPNQSGYSGSQYMEPYVIDLDPEPTIPAQNVGKSMKGSHTVAPNPGNQQSKANNTNSEVAPKKKKKSKKKKAGNVKTSNIPQNHIPSLSSCLSAKAYESHPLVTRAKILLDDAFAFHLPYMNKAAMEVDRRLRNKNIKKKHVDVLQKLVLLEKNHQKNVNSVYNTLE